MKTPSSIMLIVSLFLLSVAQSWAAVYEWVDDKGVVHFTDDADKIPAKYLQKVKERESVKGTVIIIPSTGTADGAKDIGSSTEPPAATRLDEDLWRSRFQALREEKKQLEEGLVAKREKLNTLRRKKVIYGRGSDRVAFNDEFNDIARDEASIKELEQKLKDLDTEASKAGVPLEWRQ